MVSWFACAIPVVVDTGTWEEEWGGGDILLKEGTQTSKQYMVNTLNCKILSRTYSLQEILVFGFVTYFIFFTKALSLPHKKYKDRRKGKDVCGTELFQFLVALAILHQDDFEKGMNSPYSFYCPGAIHSILQIVLVQVILFFKSSWWKTASMARNWIHSAPQAAATTFAFSFV